MGGDRYRWRSWGKSEIGADRRTYGCGVSRLAAAVVVAALAACMPPSWGAGALLHPGRTIVAAAPALPHREVAFESEGVTLRGWLFPARAPSRGATIVYLHGSGDNRASGVWMAEDLVADGFDVLAYDSRAHGASGGAACTYGWYEKRDLAGARRGSSPGPGTATRWGRRGGR
jgi:pimeloyl-ACP methyl ester carboxylesterase